MMTVTRLGGARRGLQDHAANDSRQPTRAFGDANTEQCDQHGTQRRKLHEVPDKVEDNQPQAFGVHQAYDLDQTVVRSALRAFGPWIDHRDVEEAEDARQHDDACREQRK
jgi:hypothetical protein